MSKNIRVLNAGPSVLMIDSAGHSLEGSASAEVDPEDAVTARHLEAGRLIRIEEPKTSKRTTSESGDSK
ncbi:hypothetical protein SEA_PRAIRIE_13 [Arthrobacter phage Prairie]|uniref:Uncharacterized protein n=1 Tax=Arthrobacter phage Prairie TaxID=2816463 RepID=A0A8A5LK19_9CAUD|nr:hypothetical protein SEA_PRAIRIE_13 [Arthrobacter phage Prairie]